MGDTLILYPLCISCLSFNSLNFPSYLLLHLLPLLLHRACASLCISMHLYANSMHLLRSTVTTGGPPWIIQLTAFSQKRRTSRKLDAELKVWYSLNVSNILWYNSMPFIIALNLFNIVWWYSKHFKPEQIVTFVTKVTCSGQRCWRLRPRLVAATPDTEERSSLKNTLGDFTFGSYEPHNCYSMLESSISGNILVMFCCKDWEGWSKGRKMIELRKGCNCTNLSCQWCNLSAMQYFALQELPDGPKLKPWEVAESIEVRKAHIFLT